jgi:hydroxymethylpyrimidine/phosphomethylpyrimidine kinase
VLLTTTDVSDASIEHRLYQQAKLVKSYTYDKLLGNYHGSGCTLSSAISALIASGVDIEIACKKALDYTYQTLLNAKNIGKMQFHPNRMPVKNINDRVS